MADSVKNLTLEALRNNKQRPTVSRPIDSLTTPTTPTTPEESATPTTPQPEELPSLKPVKQVRRTLRLDTDANNLVKSMLGLGEGEINVDVLLEALLLFVSEQPDDVKELVIELAKSRASRRRERSLKLRKQNRKSKSS